ncbi:alginate lyase family protein [Desulfobulbus alkaliphilus]|uniref:alginate lyase family protein n=1 Tax=Desulfobulbus alkaliphilus TaxID=869814 RepID=UPI0019626D66|nr:alginate lyase family protein [Desulfobulbus alkaliphilus]MBM9538524.1 alginate lyase family protein [Desulfobulbus alkaliphilus]
MIEDLTRLHPERFEAVVKRADQLLEGNITLFDRIFSCPRGRGWQTDPVTGHCWPSSHWSRINLVHGNEGLDPKYIWEINRHQFLLQTAMAFWVTGQEQYAEYTLEIILDWISHNPSGRGINWTESLEVATRLVAWVWALELLRGSASLTTQRLHAIIAAMITHAVHIVRYPSHYVSPNTHLTGEAWGLFLFSSVYPEIGQAAAWQSWAETVLTEELFLQVGSDGVHKELSTCYHAYTVEYYLHYVLLLLRQGLQVPEAVEDRLGKMCMFLLDVRRSDGTLPMLGDGDHGQALPLDPLGWFPGTVLPSLCAVMFKRSAFVCPDGPLPWEAIWLCGDKAEEIYASLMPQDPIRTARHYQQANYMVARAGARDNPNVLIFDAGQMGFKGAGHSHADFLHFDLTVNGSPMIVDVGTGSYHHPLWRNYGRGTSAHNTVAIDQRPQAAFGGKFSWQTWPQRGSGTLVQEPSFTLMRSSYAANRNVQHARTLLWWQGCFVICLDTFAAASTHNYTFYYHFHPAVDVRPAGEELICSSKDRAVMSMHPLFPLLPGINLVRADTASGLGHYFPQYGQSVPCTTLKIEEEIHGHVSRAMLMLLPETSEEGGLLKNAVTFPVLTRHTRGYTISHRDKIYTLHLPRPGDTLQLTSIDLQCRLLLEQGMGKGEKRYIALEVDKIDQDGVSLLQNQVDCPYCVIEQHGDVTKVRLACPGEQNA